MNAKATHKKIGALAATLLAGAAFLVAPVANATSVSAGTVVAADQAGTVIAQDQSAQITATPSAPRAVTVTTEPGALVTLKSTNTKSKKAAKPQIKIANKDGQVTGTKTENIAKIMEHHAFAVQGVSGRANQPGGSLYTDPTGMCYLELAMYSLRDDIAPEYSADVDEWLHACFGERTAEVTNWIGHALDFTRPTCALSIVGPPSMGKKILAKGLAECINTRKFAHGEEMVEQYQSAIAKTPFVNINEGFPVQHFGRSAAN